MDRSTDKTRIPVKTGRRPATSKLDRYQCEVEAIKDDLRGPSGAEDVADQLRDFARDHVIEIAAAGVVTIALMCRKRVREAVHPVTRHLPRPVTTQLLAAGAGWFIDTLATPRRAEERESAGRTGSC